MVSFFRLEWYKQMILFVADIHLKLGQKNVPVAWAKTRYRNFFKQVNNIQCDLLIIGGDLFDRLPSLEELELYFEWMESLKVETIIYPGNHEALKKNETFLDKLVSVTKTLNPLVTIITNTCQDERGFSIVPYCDLKKKAKILGLSPDEPIFTHVRGEIPPHVKPEVDLEIFDRFPVVFAGDLHSHSNCQRNIVYPGSPMTTSFHRNEVETGYILINPEDWSWTWNKFDLPQLLRKTVSSESEMIPTPFHHTIYEVEGDLQDLSTVANSELLDKKVVKRNSEASLVLSQEMSLVDELSEYLTYILELEEQKVEKVIGVFSDYSKEVEMG